MSSVPPIGRPRRRLPAGRPRLPAGRARLPAAAAALTAAVLASSCASTEGAAGGGGRSFEQIQAASLPAAGTNYLGVLTSGGGRLLVLGSDTDSLSVRYAVSTSTRAALFRNQVETIDKGDSVFVTIRPNASSTIDLQVEMPERLTVDLRDEGRDVVVNNVENRVDVLLHARGSLKVDDVEGPLTIQDGPGPISIHDVRGPIVIQDEGGGIAIHEVKNSLRIETHGGDVTIDTVGGDVNVSAGAGNLTVRNVTGRLFYRKTGTGKVSIGGVAGAVEKL